MNVSDVNVLDSVSNISASDSWFLALSCSDIAPCWVQGWPVGFVVASRRYTASNVTSATFLDLVDPNGTYNCPNFGPFSGAASYGFHALSDVATGNGCRVNACGSFLVTIARTPSVWGAVARYWN